MRLLSKGNLLEAAARGEIAGVSKLHAEYLKEMSECGVPSRRSDLPVRVEAHNHGSVHGYEDELMEKAWKDAAHRPDRFRSRGDIGALASRREPTWTRS